MRLARATARDAMRLSAIIITRNEADNIAACLESLSFADEIIVVDSGSTDETVDVALAAGATVERTRDWPGFGPQKNRALDLATGDWVLSLDADERVTPELAREIQTVLASPEHDAYEIARLSDFCGRFIRHGGWWPGYVLRLFRRGTARFTDTAIHERVAHRGPVGRLKRHLVHFPYPDLSTVLRKIDHYSSAAAAEMRGRGQRASIWSALGHGSWRFVRVYLLQRGFLDGRHGLVLALTAAAGSFFRYAKLMFLSNVGGDV